MAQYPLVYAGQTVTAELAQSWIPTHVVKASDESVTSSTTLQDDDEIQFTVEANATYRVSGVVWFGADPAGDMKLAFAGPTSATFVWVGMSGNSAAAAVTTSVHIDQQTISSSLVLGGVTANTTILAAPLDGILTVSSTAGTFKMQFAQNSSSATATTVKAGSYVELRRVA